MRSTGGDPNPRQGAARTDTTAAGNVGSLRGSSGRGTVHGPIHHSHPVSTIWPTVIRPLVEHRWLPSESSFAVTEEGLFVSTIFRLICASRVPGVAPCRGRVEYNRSSRVSFQAPAESAEGLRRSHTALWLNNSTVCTCYNHLQCWKGTCCVNCFAQEDVPNIDRF